MLGDFLCVSESVQSRVSCVLRRGSRRNVPDIVNMIRYGVPISVVYPKTHPYMTR